MIWASIIGDELVGPFRVPDGLKLTAATYCEFLKTALEPWLCNVLPMVWRVTNEPVDCRSSRGTNKHTQDRKRCSLLDNSTATKSRYYKERQVDRKKCQAIRW